MNGDRFGFSTGALEKDDFRRALTWMIDHKFACVELSALRIDELKPLVNNLNLAEGSNFTYVSFHAPSSFPKEQESHVVSLLESVFQRGWNIVVHPDVIYTPPLWKHFGSQLLVENMDRRKHSGRTVEELNNIFKLFPDARLCLDVAHARQLDTTLGELTGITRAFRDRIGEVHISELDSRCQHRPLSAGAVLDYHRFASELKGLPVIIESVLDKRHHELRRDEVRLAKRALSSDEEAAAN